MVEGLHWGMCGMTDIRLRRGRVVRITESDEERDETVPEVVSGTIGRRAAPKAIFAEGSSSLPAEHLAPVIADGDSVDSTRAPTRKLPRMQFTPPPPTPRGIARASQPPPYAATPVAVTLVRPLVARREPSAQPIPQPIRAPIRWDIVLFVATVLTLVMAGVVAVVK
jgi:hypothetical protein